MEWSIDVNNMLKDEITKIDNSLIPPGFEGDMRTIRDYNISYRLVQDSLSRVINRLGVSSAEAQGLTKVITTAEKLRTADSHTLYLLKDAAANNGKGEAIGMLKVGRKHLFLFDELETVREVEPLCVLDFYVQRDRQRAGLGKALFDHMLKDMETTPMRLAVDAPSENMVSFLRKNYDVTRLQRQNNNFAVSPSFFNELAHGASKSGSSTPSVTSAVGRYTAPKPQSSIASVIHGGVPFNPNANGVASRRRPLSHHREDWPSERSTPSSPVPPLATPPEEPPAAIPVPPAEEARRSPSRPSTLPVTAAEAPPSAEATPAGAPPSAEATAAGAPSRRDSQLTDQGFFDVKFYHKKLW